MDLFQITHGAVDLLDFFRGKQAWSRFFRLLDQIAKSVNSRYVKAQADDPEFAEAMLERYPVEDEERARKWHPANVDWSVEVEQLTKIYDRLGVLNMLVAELPTSVTQRHSPPEPHPRPLTELERLRQEREREEDERAINRLLDMVTRGQELYRERIARGEDPYGDATAERQELVTDL